MAHSKILPGILFVLLLSFIGLFLGTWIGSCFVPKGSVLAGPAIALGYGAVGLVVSAAIGIILARKLSYPKLRSALLGVSIVALIACGWLIYRVSVIKKEKESPPGVFGQAGQGRLVKFTSVPTALAEPLASEQPAGLGLIKPQLVPGQSLYFYGGADLQKLPDQQTPVDSVTFYSGPHYVDIQTAPPWFWPEIMKLDYNLLYLRAVRLARNWIEVEVNRETGQTAWVDRFAVEFIGWPVFLLDVHSVETLDPESNPLRVKPLTHAGLVLNPPAVPLSPVAIKGDWLQVQNAESREIIGWLRWRDGDRLLITYSMLS